MSLTLRELINKALNEGAQLDAPIVVIGYDVELDVMVSEDDGSICLVEA